MGLPHPHGDDSAMLSASYGMRRTVPLWRSSFCRLYCRYRRAANLGRDLDQAPGPLATLLLALLGISMGGAEKPPRKFPVKAMTNTYQTMALVGV